MKVSICLKISAAVLIFNTVGFSGVSGQGAQTSSTVREARQDTDKAVTLPNTVMQELASKQTGVNYILYISLPRKYDSTTTAYPLIVTLDADYAFALAHNITGHFADRGNLPPTIIVSIAYPGASQVPEDYRRYRTRDYTPTHTLKGGYGPAFQKFSGGGNTFRAFIAEELLPFLEKSYRIQPDDQMLVGHSYGGLFTTYVLLTKPELFQKYLIVSPSLWYDDKVIFRFERELAGKGKDLKAHVFFGVGSYENQPWNGRAMVDDIKELVALLRTRSYKSLTIDSTVFPDETHNSVFPSAFTRGVRVLSGNP